MTQEVPAAPVTAATAPSAVSVAPPAPPAPMLTTRVPTPRVRTKAPEPSTSSDAARRLAAAIYRLRDRDVKPLAAGVERIFDRHRKVRPGFSSSWVIPRPPDDADVIVEYEVEGIRVRIYDVPGDMDNLYFFVPPEYRFPLPILKLLDEAKKELTEHRPRGLEVERPEDVRKYVEQVAERLIPQIARRLGVKLGETRYDETSTPGCASTTSATPSSPVRSPTRFPPARPGPRRAPSRSTTCTSTRPPRSTLFTRRSGASAIQGSGVGAGRT